MNLSELLLFLDRIERRPNRGLSQNFLIDGNIVSKIVRLANVAPGDIVLEIGPGPGALTSALLNAGAKVYAIEKDPVFAKELNRFQTPDNRLTSIHEDFLKFDLSSLPSPLKVVANLPYHITTPILETLLDHRNQFSSFTLMVQNELAIRMVAKAGNKEFSSLSLFIQFYCTLDDSFKVPSGCFYPKPNVDSKVVHFLLHTPPLENSAPFFALVRRAFQQRRKMIRTSLSESYPTETLEEALVKTGVKADARPESLSLANWLEFYKQLTELGRGS